MGHEFELENVDYFIFIDNDNVWDLGFPSRLDDNTAVRKLK